jgi:hypothetical protein
MVTALFSFLVAFLLPVLLLSFHFLPNFFYRWCPPMKFSFLFQSGYPLRGSSSLLIPGCFSASCPSPLPPLLQNIQGGTVSYTGYRTLYTGHCTTDTGTPDTGTPDTVHRTLDTGHCTSDTVHRTLYTGHCRPDTVHRTLYTGHCTPDTVHRTLAVVTGHLQWSLDTGRCTLD